MEQGLTIGDMVGSRWQITRFLGEGGFGQVFQATDTSSIGLGDSALKVLHPNTSPQERNEFLGEVKKMAQLRHQNLVGYLDSGQIELGDQLHPYLVTELCSVSLADYVSEQPSQRLGTDDVLAILVELADGLAYLHARDLIHRDIKPGNVLYGNGNWKLADFGLMRDTTATGSYHRGEAVTGTPAFMSPELFATTRATSSSDVYALGVLAHVCLAGRGVFAGAGQALIQNIMTSAPSIDPSLEPDAARLIAEVTSREEQNRPSAAQIGDWAASLWQQRQQPQQAGATAGAVDPQFAATQPFAQQTKALPPPQTIEPLPYNRGGTNQSAGQPQPTKNRWLPAVVAGGAVAVLLLGFGYWLSGPDSETDPTAAPERSVADGVAADESESEDSFAQTVTTALPAGIEPVDGSSPEVIEDEPAGVDDSGVQIGDGVEIGDGVQIGGSGDTDTTIDGSGANGADALALYSDGVCVSGRSLAEATITNTTSSHQDFLLEVVHLDANGIVVDEGATYTRAIEPGGSFRPNVGSFEDGVVACEVTEFSVQPVDSALVDNRPIVEQVSCEPGSFANWMEVEIVVRNSSPAEVDIEAFIGARDDSGLWLGQVSIWETGIAADRAVKASGTMFMADGVDAAQLSCQTQAVDVDS